MWFLFVILLLYILQEVACISSATNKWLDANEFLAGRLQLKQQKAAGQQF
jgi:hypothetical protein